MSSTQKSSFSSAKRLLATAASAAMIFALLPAGVALGASPDNVCPPPDGVETFPDVTDGVHADNVECLAGYDIAGGYADGTYRPGVDISRAQMATFIANFIEAALGTTLDAGDDAFTDDEGNVHEANINKLANINVVSGRTAVTYGPSLKVQRASMSTFIANALDYLDDQDATNNTFPPASTTDHFTDDEASTHEANINRLADLGIVEGQDSATEFNPGNNVFRGQMASFVMQAASAAEDEGLWAANDDAPTTPAGFTVSPSDAAVNDASTSSGTTANQGARTYTVSGLDDAKAYDIALFPSENITFDDDGNPLFKDADSNNQADGEGDTDALIEVVNGAATTGDEVNNTSPIDGKITFTVDSTQFDEVVPVVWTDADSGNNGTLNLVVPTTSNANPKSASDPVAIGGQKTWVPAEAPTQNFDGEVLYVDKDEDFFVLKDTINSNTRTYFYATGDSFLYETSSAITMTQFETALSVGDGVNDGTGTYSRTFQSTFNIYTDVLSRPTDLTATTIGDIDGQNDNYDATFTWNAPSPPNGLIASYQLAVYDDDPNTAGCQTTTAVSGSPFSSTSTSHTVNDLSNDTYCAQVRTVSEEGSTSSYSTAIFFTVQKGDADTTAPLINNLYLETDSGTSAVIDTGDAIHFDFSERMATATANGTLRFTDPDGENFDVICSGTNQNANCSLTNYTSGSTTITDGRLVVTMTAAPRKVGGATPSSNPGVAQVPGEVINLSTHFDDTSGNQVDLANSPDDTIDNEF